MDVAATKQCSACGRVFPKTQEHFYARGDGRISGRCKECCRRASAERYVGKRTEIRSECNRRYHEDVEFRERKRASDARSYRNHREARLAQYAEYRGRPEVKERLQAYFKQLRRDPAFVADKKRYLAQRHLKMAPGQEYAQRRREAFKSYWQSNRERYRAHVRNRRARLLESEGSHTAEDIHAQITKQSGLCFWCGGAVSGGRHTVDHYVPLARGGSNGPENLVIACGTCNSRKGAKMPDEFLRYLGEINV